MTMPLRLLRKMTLTVQAPEYRCVWDLAGFAGAREPNHPPSVNVTSASSVWSALIYSSSLGSP